MIGFVLLTVAFLYCAYWILSLNFSYWKKRGVPNPPVSVLFGNVGPTLSLKKSLGQLCTDIYNAYPDYLYVGYYKIRQPGVIIRDSNLIRDVLVKEFSSFHDNDVIIDEKIDPVGGKNPFVLKGNRWKIVKNQLTPCFTPKKLKGMYPLIEQAAKKLTKYLESEKECLDAKELSAKYTTEVVAKCAFGLEGKSFDEPNPEFREMGKKIFEQSLSVTIKLILILLVPSVSNLLKFRFFPENVDNYFQNILTQTLKYREENNIIRNDFLDYMLELKSKSQDHTFTDVDILAHSLGFFTDGFETTAGALSNALFELGANSDAQEKLRTEIDETIKRQSDGKLDYDSLNDMQYLDAVINEVLRLHPPGMLLFRMCTKEFTFPPPKGAGTGPSVVIEEGTLISIPVYALHHDPAYFPDPERFDPTRFMGNKDAKLRTVFIPFGEGPRNCHGQRFGILQLKIAIFSIVSKYEIDVNNKTRTPLEIDPTSLLLQPKGGIWLNFRGRK